MEILANFISILHFIFIVYILFGWTSDKLLFLFCHIFICLFLMLHWVTKNDMCALTLLESSLRDIPMKDTFMKRIVSPIYVIRNETMTIISWVFTVLAMSFSIYKIYNSELLPLFLNCISEIYNSNDESKIDLYMSCIERYLV
jgi:hypothetical protein